MLSKTMIVRVICVLTFALVIFASGQAQRNQGQEAKAGELSEASIQLCKQQAQELSDAMLKGDFARMADLTYPKLVELMGGRARYVSAVRQSMNEMQTEETRFLSVTAGEPYNIFKVANRYYALVPTTTRIKVPPGVLVGEAYIIGTSTDGGAHWTFVDPGDDDAAGKQKLRILFPDAADKMKLPEIKRPTLYKN